MTRSTAEFDAPAWDAVYTASPGLDRLIAALRATRAACDAIIRLTPRTAGIDPASGWQTADGLLGLLESTFARPTVGDLPLATPRSLGYAGLAVDRLLRTAADAALAAAEDLRANPRTEQLLALAAVMRELSAGYQRTFGRPW